MKKLLTPLAIACLATAPSFADTVTTIHGDVINGKITLIHAGKVSIETAFAGTLSIAREDIKSIDYTEPEIVYARKDASIRDKTEVKIQKNEAGETQFVNIADEALSLQDVATVWAKDAEDPDFPTPKEWSGTFSLGFNGHKGSTEDFNASFYADAIKTATDYRLKLYTSMTKSRSEGEETAAQYIAGLDYEHLMRDSEKWSIYLRDEVQHNRYSDYRLRNVAAAGVGYYVFKETVDACEHSLRLRAGIAYTYTDHYSTDPVTGEAYTSNDIALDLGLLFHWDFTNGLKWTTELTYTPVIDDPANGVIVHETKVSYLLKDLENISEKLAGIALEAGVRNEYQTEVENDVEDLDTAWFLRFSKSW